MPRLPRDLQPGLAYHLISRFVDRNWYITSEDEREYYLWLLGRAIVESDWRGLAYGVMSNHVHLCAIAGTQRLDSWVRRVHAPFADRMNVTHDRIGVMFVRGPKAIPIRDHEVASVIAYIHNNPVRAKVVGTAGESTWTSHRAYVGLDVPPPWLRVDEGLARAGFCNRVAFDQFVAGAAQSSPGPTRSVPLCDDEGSADYRRRPALAAVVTSTAAELGVSIAQLRSRRRGSLEVTARRAVVHAAGALGITGVEIAQALGISQQAVSVIGRIHPADRVRAVSSRVLERLRTDPDK